MTTLAQRPYWWSILACAVLLALPGCDTDADIDAELNSRHSAVVAGADLDVSIRVKIALLSDQQLGPLDVNVETVKGEVRLIGSLGSQIQINRAITVARGIVGARTIRDELTLKPPLPANRFELSLALPSQNLLP